jgi:hypothetical protein
VTHWFNKPMQAFNPKPRPCAQCQSSFTPVRPMQKVCGPRCAMVKVRTDKKTERATTRARKQAIKTIPDLIKEAQRDFNAYIRERDRLAGHLCISSGRVLDWSGNAVDAGHYRSVGSASHLRFNEHNCHAQSKHDNQYKSGNAVDYRIGLIQRIGIEAVEALESDNRVHKWGREELIAIRDTYKAKLKQLKERA